VAGKPAGAGQTKKARLVRLPRVGRRPGRQRRSRRLFWAAIGVGVAALIAVGIELIPLGGPNHAISTPPRLGPYLLDPSLAARMHAEQLRDNIVANSDGEASHVVYGVYADNSTAVAKSGPLVMLFIGGNLSGSSPSSFISSFMGKLAGAAPTSAGSLGGEAACVPGGSGRLAECAWADNDTFGLVASPTLSATALARELRQVRGLVEHVAR
jgi:hypothetical protein